jgi:hypothetical protein
MKTVANSAAGWDDDGVSNRRRTPADRARDRAAAQHASRPRSRPFGGRARVTRRSYALLERLHAMPRWSVPLATLVLVFVGLFAGRVVGGLCLLAVAAFLGWLSYLAWPRLSRGGRVARAAMLGMVTGVGLARLFGVWG